jgi:ParB family chromosome partitioning protein
VAAAAASVTERAPRPVASATRARRAAPPSIAAVALDGESRSIPLSSLELSPRNVRKSAATGIEELAALIRAQGLLQPLCVTPLASGTPPRFEVTAGGRRLRALQWLAARGELPADAPVECKLFDASRAHEVSLAENSARQAMHPADQCEAFKAMIDAGRTVDEVALRFGVSAQTVQRRLRLAGIAPELVALFRAGEASLEQMQALAITDDTERQLAVWHGADSWARQPWQLRSRLLAGEVPASDSRVRFVGLDAYEAAGGTVRRDLFAEHDDAFVTDPVLLDRLVSQRLHDEADTVRAEGWAWCEPRLSFDYPERANYLRIERPRRALTEDESHEAETLRARLAALDERLRAMEEAEDEEGAEAAESEAQNGDALDTVETAERVEDEADRIRVRLRDLQTVFEDWTPAHRAEAGAIVSLERGQLVVTRGLVRREDAVGGVGAVGKQDAGRDAAREAAPAARPEHPERLTLALLSHLTCAMQATLVASPNVALAVLAHRLVMQLRAPYRDSLLRIDARGSADTLERHAPEIGQSRAGEALARERDRWGELLPGEPLALLRWLLGQPVTTLVEVLAFCTAETVDATQGGIARRDDTRDAIRQALGLDMADWWEPTAQTYLDAVPKARIVQAVAEACGAQAAADLASMKKADAVKAAEARLAGTRWLPTLLRPAAVIGAGEDETSGE